MEYIEKIKEFIISSYPNLEIRYKWIDNEKYIPHYVRSLCIHIKCKGCDIEGERCIFTCKNYDDMHITFCSPFTSIYKKNTTSSEQAWNDLPKYYVRLLEGDLSMGKIFKGECCNRHLIVQLADLLRIDNNGNNFDILNSAIVRIQNMN